MTVFETSGPRLLADGRELQLHGVNLHGMETDGIIFGLWANKTIDHFLDHIKKRQFNTLRLPIGSKNFRNDFIDANKAAAWSGGVNENTFRGKGCLDFLDMLIEGCEKRGLYFYLNSYVIDGPHIPPLWHFNGYTEDQWIKDIVKVAERYRSAKGFIGIDTKNEPSMGEATWGTGDSRTDWKMANEKVWDAVKNVNSNIILIVETLNAGGSLTPMLANPLNIPKNKVAYSPHTYFNDVWERPTWAMAGLRERNPAQVMPPIWDGYYGNEAQNACIIVGEWGGKALPGSPDRDTQIAFRDYLKSKNILNHTYWCWGKDSGDTSGIVTDDQYSIEDAFKIDLLSSLRTPNARFSNEAPPAVTHTPPPKTEVNHGTTTPASAGNIALGNTVQFATREGPKMVVVQIGNGFASCAYMGPSYVVSKIPLNHLVKV